MSLVQFRYRRSKPTEPVMGSFYWVDLGDKVEIWFSPDGIEEHLVLLSNEVDASIVSRLSDIEERLSTEESEMDSITDVIDAIQEALEGIDLSEYVKLEDLPSLIELSDSDYDIIVERVNEKVVPPLRWIEI